MLIVKIIQYSLFRNHPSLLVLLLTLILPNALAQNLTGAQATDGPSLIPQEGIALYDREHPVIGYSTQAPKDRFARLGREIATGKVSLNKNSTQGYLSDLLEKLEIDPDSQTLVYSRTSLNTGLIRANNPRAIYFNDDTYVAWVPGTNVIEIATMDPNLGPVFYTFDPDSIGIERQSGQCLRCHDSLTLSGGGVPRFILGSGYTYFSGSLVSHEGWILTDQETPIKFRWGGWYVTGQHGKQVHLGNIVVSKAEELQDLEQARIGNINRLEDFFKTELYLTPNSDIDALMVLEHQVQIQNMITRVNYDVRNLIVREFASVMNESGISQETNTRIAEIIEPLVKAMFMVGEAEITDNMNGNTGYRNNFEARGPVDSKGRSLRQLDLESRLFRYPMSYLVYSSEFNALPSLAKDMIFERFNTILNGNDSSGSYIHLNDSDRIAIYEILTETHPDFQ
jgi:hypothetical protein